MIDIFLYVDIGEMVLLVECYIFEAAYQMAKFQH